MGANQKTACGGKNGIAARLVVVGFDAAAPAVISSFVAGSV